MKQFTILCLIVTLVFTLNAVSPALADQPEETAQSHGELQQPDKQESVQEESAMHSGIMENEQVGGSTLPLTLDQIIEELSQESLAADARKELALQLKALAGNLPVGTNMAGNTVEHMAMTHKKSGGCMKKDKMMGHMPMSHKKSGGGMMGNMMEHIPMMHSGRELHEYSLKESGLQLQMRGEIMQAVGGVLQKYGKLIAEQEATAATTPKEGQQLDTEKDE